jgi:hypothetical protein
MLQILGGMFEQAVAYLGTYSPVTAVHFAIALAYYGLLRVSDFYASGEEIRKEPRHIPFDEQFGLQSPKSALLTSYFSGFLQCLSR